MRMFWLFGKKAKYEGLNWFEMGGHITIGKMTIYGANAMCWAVNIRTKKWGYICFTLPSIRRRKYKFGHYFYLSPNGTPCACTYYRGIDKNERIRADIRKLNLGHNFDANNEVVGNATDTLRHPLLPTKFKPYFDLQLDV